MEQDLDIPLDLSDKNTGQYPHRFTQDDRFQYRAKIQPVAGYLEVSIRPMDTRPAATLHQWRLNGSPKRGVTSSAAKDPDDSLHRAKMRAKSMVKLLAMEMKIDRMFTFTIRNTGELVPYDTVLKAWDSFRRLMEKHYKDFRYLATPEKQKSGQWHIHAGVHGFMDVKVLLRLWHYSLNRALGRSVMLTAGKDSPGHVHIRSNENKFRCIGVRRSIRIASYISKYIGKSLDAEFNRKRYFHSYGVKVTPAQRKWLAGQNRESALLEVLETMGIFGASLPESAPLPDLWYRDSVSVWFRILVDDIPPPF
jgi:hypothetical protein